MPKAAKPPAKAKTTVRMPQEKLQEFNEAVDVYNFVRGQKMSQQKVLMMLINRFIAQQRRVPSADKNFTL